MAMSSFGPSLKRMRSTEAKRTFLAFSSSYFTRTTSLVALWLTTVLVMSTFCWDPASTHESVPSASFQTCSHTSADPSSIVRLWADAAAAGATTAASTVPASRTGFRCECRCMVVFPRLVAVPGVRPG